jgi:hypothetical protein
LPNDSDVRYLEDDILSLWWRRSRSYLANVDNTGNAEGSTPNFGHCPTDSANLENGPYVITGVEIQSSYANKARFHSGHVVH